MLNVGDVLICYNDKNKKNQKLLFLSYIGAKFIILDIKKSTKHTMIDNEIVDEVKHYIIKRLDDNNNNNNRYIISDSIDDTFYYWRDHFRSLREERIKKLKNLGIC